MTSSSAGIRPVAALLPIAFLLAAVVLADPPASGAAEDSLPASLAAALARRDPAALGDTALPRLAALAAAGALDDLAAALEGWPLARRVAAYAFLQVGTPYAAGPLGEEAPPDTDPIVRFDRVDCTVLNLLAEALAHAAERGPDGLRAAMIRAGYRGGVVSYDSRLHFTVDRIDESPFEEDATRRLAAAAGLPVRARRATLNRRAGGGRWIPIDWVRARDVAYIPRAAARRLGEARRRGALPEAVGVAFVREDRLADGLDVVHEGLLWRGATLVHASSRNGRAVAVPWRAYLDGDGRRNDGVVLFTFR